MFRHVRKKAPAWRDFIQLALAGVAAVGIGLLLGTTQAQERSGESAKVSQKEVDKILADWPEKPKEVARKMLDKYGSPNEATATHLVWHKNGPWKYTVLYRKEVPHLFPKKHVDMLEQVIDYKIPPEKFSQLAAYDGSVTVRRTEGEISAMCDKEEMNFLALNLAHDIIAGEKNIEEARAFYAKTAMAFMKGEKHPYTEGLQFSVPKGGTGDPDHEFKKK